MNKENKIFLSVCGSILAIVAIAIFLSFGSGDSYAVPSSGGTGCYYCGSYMWGDYSDENCSFYPKYTTKTACEDANDNSGSSGGSSGGGTGSGSGSGSGSSIAECTPGSSYVYVSNAAGSSCLRTSFPDGSGIHIKSYNKCDIVNACQSTKDGNYYYTSDDCYIEKNTISISQPSSCNSGGGGSTQEPTKYTITYNANGGSDAPSSQEKTHGTDLTLSSAKPTRDGYTFKGWATSSTATTATYQPGDKYTSNESTTLYAVWSVNKYTITYNANGGSGAPSSQEKTHGTDLTLSSTKPTRDGYTFKGWGTSSTATTATYQAGGKYTANASATLYAVWEKSTSEKYKIIYDANGGTNAPTQQEKEKDKDLNLSSKEPTMEDFDFKEWNTKKDGTGTTYLPGATYKENNDLTLYAQWVDNSMCSILYIIDEENNKYVFQSFEKNTTAVISKEIPTKKAYTFGEWNTEKDGSGETYKPGDSYSGNKDLVLYAIWGANKGNKSDDEITVNSKTGNALILVAFTTGLAALCYIFLYSKKMKNNN